MTKKVNYLSMFSGIGGFEHGIENSNKKEVLQCVGFMEIDKYAKNIYKKHYPNHTDYGDATRVQTEDIPEIEFLVGGFPCQAFSVAGKRGGFNDTRGTLFFEIARILQDKRPKYFLLENVKGLLSHNKGETFQTMLETLSQLGYDVLWEIYNSKNYGVPQNRERLYIKGYLRSRCGCEILSIRRPSAKTAPRQNETKTQIIPLNDASQAQKIYDIHGVSTTLSANGGGQGGKTGLYNVTSHDDNGGITLREVDEDHLATTTKEGDFFALTTRQRSIPFKKKQDNHILQQEEPSIQKVGNIYPSEGQAGQIYNSEGLCPSLDCRGGGKKKILLRNNTRKGYVEATVGDGVDLANMNGRGRRQKQSTPTMDTRGNVGTITNEYRIRRLTPVECERLQGFPDNWTKYGYNGELISNTQRYKCCGNAVTTNVVTYIMDNWNMKINTE